MENLETKIHKGEYRSLAGSGEFEYAQGDLEEDRAGIVKPTLSNINSDLGWILMEKTTGDAHTAVRTYKRGEGIHGYLARANWQG